MGYSPQISKTCLGATLLPAMSSPPTGKTSPGQSTTSNSGVSCQDWRCLVWPGVCETEATWGIHRKGGVPTSALSIDLFPIGGGASLSQGAVPICFCLPCGGRSGCGCGVGTESGKGKGGGGV
eukprot:scaffold4275_cov69-Isochrysis_galbana.AAC.1